MTKKDLIKKTSDALDKEYNEQDIALAVNAVFCAITKALGDNQRVEIRGFGSFSIHEHRARKGRNPKTGAPVDVTLRKVPFFKVGKELKDIVDGKDVI
jgi:integration host factor subunit beta